jgi:hypothetical protein
VLHLILWNKVRKKTQQIIYCLIYKLGYYFRLTKSLSDHIEPFYILLTVHNVMILGK